MKFIMYSNIIVGRIEDSTNVVLQKGVVLTGMPVCCGIAVARARVAKTNEEAAGMQAGTVQYIRYAYMNTKY